MINKERETPQSVSVEDLLLALVTLEVDRRESTNKESGVKTELLLSNAGLGASQIAKIMGKNPNAVRMMIARSKTVKRAKGKD